MAADDRTLGGGEEFGDFKDFTAREPDTYAEAFRQREILRASSDVNQLFTEAKEAMEKEEIDKNAQRGIVRAAVEQMIVDVEHIATKVGATELLEERNLYTVRLSPPDVLWAIIARDDVRVIGQPDLEPKTAGTIQGLWGYLNAPEYFEAEWTVQVDVRHGKQQPLTRPSSSRMPVEASRETFRAIRSFLAEIELDLGPNLPDYMGEEGPGI